MKRHHAEDDRANEDIVGKTWNANQDNAVPHHAQNQHADDRSDDCTSPAGERRAADDDHRDHLQFVAGAAVRISRRNPDRAGDTGVRGDDRRQDEEQYLGLRDAHTARASRVLVAARSLNPVACFGLRQHVAEDDREQDEPEKRRVDTQCRRRKIVRR